MANSTKKRLFIALHVHDEIQAELAPIVKKLRQNADQKNFEIKWSRPENLHISLFFLGEIPIVEIPQIIEQLNAVSEMQIPFQLKIEDISAFPDVYAGRVIYLGVQRSQKILDLVTLIESKLNKNISETYIPHLTIGRLRNPKSVKDLISPFVRKKFGKINATEMILYESIQAGPFPIYKQIQKFEFKLAIIDPVELN